MIGILAQIEKENRLKALLNPAPTTDARMEAFAVHGMVRLEHEGNAILGFILSKDDIKAELTVLVDGLSAPLVVSADRVLGRLEDEGVAVTIEGLRAADPVAEPKSRGGAPQTEDLAPRAAEAVDTLSTPPSKIDKMKKGPKSLTKEVAQSAPEANAGESALLTSANALETEIAVLETQMAAAVSELKKSTVDRKQSLITALNTLYEVMDKNKRRVIRFKEAIIAVDEQRDIKEANLSPQAKKKAEEAKAKMDKKREEIKAIQEELEALTSAQFEKYGGKQTEVRRITETPNPAMAASLGRLCGLLGAGESFVALRAGILDTLKSLWSKLKTAFDGFDGIEKDIQDYAELAAA